MREWRWLAQMLFFLACLIAGALVLLVVLAPSVEANDAPASIWRDMLDLFARDVVVRRISVATAIGLVVTAFIFFLPRRSYQQRASRRSSSQSPPSTPVAGA